MRLTLDPAISLKLESKTADGTIAHEFISYTSASRGTIMEITFSI